MGVVGVIAPATPALLGLISLTAPVIVSGNTAVVLASEPQPYPAILLGELLATSDLPAGVVNVLTGTRADLLPTFATHAHLRGLSAVADAAERRTLDLGAAESVKRVRYTPDAPLATWLGDAAQGLEPIRAFTEAKTTWHPIGA
jgi:aldehyde dehydrogenase (NAD+)